MNKKLTLRCYCCGQPIKDRVALTTSGGDVQDRVFTMLPEHIKCLDDPENDVLMARIEEKAS